MLSKNGDGTWTTSSFTKLKTSVAIALAESGGDAHATHVNTNGSTDRGLWQINSIHGYGTASCNPDNNAKEMWSISGNGSNWRPWYTYTGGQYLTYIGRATAAVHATEGTSAPPPTPGGVLVTVDIVILERVAHPT